MADRVKVEVMVLPEYCKGCGLCVAACATGKLVWDEKPSRLGVLQVHVDPDVRCTGCLKCAMMCPDAAIEIRRADRKKEKVSHYGDDQGGGR
jgi:2-oxoglutarate ferredoxin oxidoreductase subunit delta